MTRRQARWKQSSSIPERKFCSVTCSILILLLLRGKFFNLGFVLTNSAQFPMAMPFRARWLTFSRGPTSDDITRELIAGHLKLPLIEDATVHEAIRTRLAARRIPTTERIWRQA